ncbi:MAG: response regulator [Parcubacteria group bacterium]|nr:response regulator [Parcubacteria group bacterium]
MTETEKPKILLVDDNEMVRIFFRDIFWLHGLEKKYDLEISGEINAAEKIIKDPARRPSVLFLDLVMPMAKGERLEKTEEAGFGLLKKIKADPGTKNTRVVIFSSHRGDDFQKKAAELGADLYLVKGENLPQDLVRTIEEQVAAYLKRMKT